MKQYIVKNVSKFLVEIEVNGKKEYLKPKEEKIYPVIPTTKFKEFIQVIDMDKLNKTKEEKKKDDEEKIDTAERTEENKSVSRKRGRKKKSN